MAFALILTKGDMELVRWCLAQPGQSAQDATRSQAILDGGLSNWVNASRVPVTHPYYDNDPDMILVNVTAPNLTLAQFRTRAIAFARKYPWASQIESLANEHWGDVAYAVEPWPFPGDPWDGIPREPAQVTTTTTTTTERPTTTTLPPPPTTTTPQIATTTTTSPP